MLDLDIEEVYRRSGAAFNHKWEALAKQNDLLHTFATQLKATKTSAQLLNVLELMLVLNAGELSDRDIHWIKYLQAQLRLFKDHRQLMDKLKAVFNAAVDQMEPSYDNLDDEFNDFQNRLLPFLDHEFDFHLDAYSHLIGDTTVADHFKAQVEKFKAYSKKDVLYLFLKESPKDILETRLFAVFNFDDFNNDYQKQYVRRLHNSLTDLDLTTTALIMVVDAQLQQWLHYYCKDSVYECMQNYTLAFFVVSFEYQLFDTRFIDETALRPIFKFEKYMQTDTLVTLNGLSECSIIRDRGDVSVTYSFNSAECIQRVITYDLIQMLLQNNQLKTLN